MVAHAFHPSTWESEVALNSLSVKGDLELLMFPPSQALRAQVQITVPSYAVPRTTMPGYAVPGAKFRTSFMVGEHSCESHARLVL